MTTLTVENNALGKYFSISYGFNIPVATFSYWKLIYITRINYLFISGDLSKIQPGDCIVCFSKNDIFNVSLDLEKRGFECAVIYGSLPPGIMILLFLKFWNVAVKYFEE